MLTIRDCNGDVLLNIEPCDGSRRVHTLMVEDYISVVFSLALPVHIGVGAYVVVDGFGRFEVTEPQQPTLNERTGGWDYELQFDAHYIKWRNKIFRYIPEDASAEAAWSLTASLDVHMGVFLRNLTSHGYTYNDTPYTFAIDASVANVSRHITYENKSMLDALYEMAETFECEVWVEDSVIRFGRCEYGDAIELRQDTNVESMVPEGNRATYATRIYAFGSERNLPTSYRPTSSSIVVNGVVQRRLMLPIDTPYVDAKPGMTTEEAVEQVVLFDDVYPRTESAISDITTKQYSEVDEDGNPTGDTWDAYRFKVASLTFREEYILADTELQVVFQNGLLAGMTFNVKFNPEGESESDPNSQLWEIIRNEDYGRPLPDATLRPNNGDRVVLVGWDASKIASLGLIAAAEQELKQRAIAKMEQFKIDPSNYRCKMISAALFDAGGTWQPYTIGSRVTLINASFVGGRKSSRIIGLEYDLCRPYSTPTYIVGEKSNTSRTAELESKIESLTLAGQTYVGGSGSGVYVIRTNDSTAASDTNVYSALRARREHLSRQGNDTAFGIIRFLRGLLVGNGSYGISEDASARLASIIADSLRTPDFISGDLGSGFAVYRNGDSTRMEVDELLVRRIATFLKLEIRELAYVAGNIVLSNAASEIASVTEVRDDSNNLIGWRCGWTCDDGTTATTNTWMAGDQARCQTFNIAEGVYENVSNRYYWRLVTEIGDDYVILSSSDHDSSTDNGNPNCIPRVGDKIVQMGYRLGYNASASDPTDESNKDRTSLMELSTNGEDAPSIKAFHGVVDYDLKPSRRVFLISPTGVVFNSDYFRWSSGGVSFPQRVYKGDWSEGTHANYFEEYTWLGCSWLCVNANGTDDEPSLDSGDWKLVAGNPDSIIATSSRTMRFISEYGEYDTFIAWGERVKFYSVIEDGLRNDHTAEYNGWSIRRHNGDTPDDIASDGVWNVTRAQIADDGTFYIEWSAAHDDLQAERATYIIQAHLASNQQVAVTGYLSI